MTNLLNKNEVLDLCIDGEQEVTRFEKQNQQFPSRSTAPYLGQGRPPRPHSTAPSSPKLRKEIIESPSNIDIDDAWHSQLAHGGANGTCKVASMCHGGGHDARHFKVCSQKLSHFEEPRSQTMTTVEDIYEDLQDVRPPSPFFYSSSTDPVSSATSRYFAADISFQEESRGDGVLTALRGKGEKEGGVQGKEGRRAAMFFPSTTGTKFGLGPRGRR